LHQNDNSTMGYEEGTEDQGMNHNFWKWVLELKIPYSTKHSLHYSSVHYQIPQPLPHNLCGNIFIGIIMPGHGDVFIIMGIIVMVSINNVTPMTQHELQSLGVELAGPTAL
jgi:hypothetical protein